MTTFLDKLADEIVRNYKDDIVNTIVVLPNKRAKIFLMQSLKKSVNQNIFAPEIISVEELIQNISNIRLLDSIELLFEFYEVYKNLTLNDQQNFELFSNWAKTLLQDFNEIDRYLLDPNYVLRYINDIEDIKKWDVTVENRTSLLENYVDFWKLLPSYYHSLYKHLLDQKVGYQGLIYRETVNNLNKITASEKKYIFAGFNALNAAEEKIIQHFLLNTNAKLFWDADQTFLNDPFHDAGLFLRRFKSKWKHYNTNTFDWIVDEFSKPKNIEIIGTPKSIGQAKIVGKIIENILDNTADSMPLEKVAIVLAEENLLIPVIHSLPEKVGHLNITMGYSSLNNPVQILISKLFKTHNNAIKRNPINYVFYYKDIIDILTHPLIEPFVNASNIVTYIKKNNFSFIPNQKLFELNENYNDLFLLLFKKWEMTSVEILTNLSNLLIFIKEKLNNDNEEEKLSKSFVFSIYKTINKLINYCSKDVTVDSIETLFMLYKQIIDLAEVSFEGEPLSGLQIMGVLESRVLDFETVIITSMNEGVLPAGKSMNSFIPYDVKRELELPTYKEKDAIYTYHFYHLLQRAKNVFLLYNTLNEGLDGGEKSRFITQIEIEKQSNHTIINEKYNPTLPKNIGTLMSVPKTDIILERLKEINRRGFSPSTLTLYIRNPFEFYLKRILQINQNEDVEEDIALNTLGDIIHKTLEELLKPLLNIYLTEKHIDDCFSKLDFEIERQFKLNYKEGNYRKGKNLLAFEVAKRNVSNYLDFERNALIKGDTIKILYLESYLERIIDDSRLPYPVKISGNVDKIELRNNIIRITDYKTGKVIKSQLVLKDWDKLIDSKNDKKIQLLAYAYMIENQVFDKKIEAGIISFKNMSAGFMPFTFTNDNIKTTSIDTKMLENFENEMISIISEILNPNINFEEIIV